MNSIHTSDSNNEAVSKSAYQKPEVKRIGTISEFTRNVNVVSGGDSVFSVLAPS